MADSTEYGSVAGLKGANCNHDFYPFFPGLSKQRFFPYDKEENDKRYAEFQQQRGIEREIRQWKAREQGALAQGDAAGAAKAHSKVAEKQGKMRELLRNNGNERRYNREQIVRNSSQTGGGGSIIRPEGTPPGGGILSDVTRRSIPITDDAINSVPKFNIKGFTEQQNNSLRQAMQDVLRDAKNIPLGNEAIAYYDKSFNLLAKYAGTAPGKVKVMNFSAPYYAFHNHPDGLTFSETDIKRLLGMRNLMGIGAVGNQGSAYALIAGAEADAIGARNLLFKTMQLHPGRLNSADAYVAFIEDYLGKVKQYGYSYYS